VRVAVVIPALNEEEALPGVLADLDRLRPGRVIVVDNGSDDRTPEIALEAGAELVIETRRGYGSACLAGFAHLEETPPDIVVILDADGSDHVDDLPLLLRPILKGEADMVLGERVSLAERGALMPNQRFGNLLATRLIRRWTGWTYKDMGPFRAIRWDALQAMHMTDPAYGWNVEMQMKAVQAGLRIDEVPVRYRPRGGGRSKISGTIRGTIKAGIGILRATWRYKP